MCCYRIGSRELGLVAFVLFAFLVVIVLHGYWAHGVSLNVRHDGGRYVRGEPLVLFVRQRDEGGFLNHKSYGFEFISHDSGGRSESIHKYPDYYQGTTDRDGDPELIEEPGFSSMHRIRAKLPLGNVRITARVTWQEFGFIDRAVESDGCNIMVEKPTFIEDVEIQEIPSVLFRETTADSRCLSADEETQLRDYVHKYQRSRMRKYVLFELSLRSQMGRDESVAEYLKRKSLLLDEIDSVSREHSLLHEYTKWMRDVLIWLSPKQPTIALPTTQTNNPSPIAEREGSTIRGGVKRQKVP